jgi:WD40 repeat protein
VRRESWPVLSLPAGKNLESLRESELGASCAAPLRRRMPTTRAARRAAARAAARLLLELPADALGLVLYQLPLAHDIAAVAPTCHALDDAAKLAIKARPFSGEVVTLAGHTNYVRCVAVVPDGRVITGSADRTVKVWRDGACERTIQAHADSVRAMAVLPGGARFVSASDDETAKLWTLDGALERTFALGMANYPLCAAALPDGVHFVVGLRFGEVRLYHVDGTLVHTFEGQIPDHEDEEWSVDAVALTPDGQHIISGSYDKLVKVWSVATKSLVSTCTGHTGSVLAVAVTPDGQRILSGGRDKTVRVWLLDGTLENTFRRRLVRQTEAVRALVALPDNQHALSGFHDKTVVKLFNVNDGAVLRTFTHHTEPVVSLALLPDGLRFVSGSDYHTACIVEHGLAPFVA